MSSADYTTRGTHVVCDIHAYTSTLTIDDVIDAAYIANMTIVGVMESEMSMALILAESHLTVHMRGDTIAVDVYTCGDDAKPMAAVMALLGACGATVAFVTEFERGDDALDATGA